MFPYPSGAGPARRPLRGLHRDRHRRALEADAGVRRAAPDGLGRVRPARRALRHQARRPPARHDRADDRQLPAPARAVGFAYDWAREIDTTDPAYVRWTQWIFLQALRARPGVRGASSRSTGARRARPCSPTKRSARGAASAAAARSSARTCGSGCCASPRYADRLLERSGRARLARRRRWRCSATGSAAARAPRSTFRRRRRSRGREIRVFTTRPDTLFGATYMVLAPEHPLVAELTTPAQRAAVDGVPGRGARARATSSAPSWPRRRPASFTGATRSTRSTASRSRSGSPTTCWRATAPARSWRCRRTTSATSRSRRSSACRSSRSCSRRRAARVDPDAAVHRRRRRTSTRARSTACRRPRRRRRSSPTLEARGVGKGAVSYRLRDWVFSRQRYWGEPIPLVHCPNDGVVAGARDAAAGRAARRRALRADRHRRVAAGRDRELRRTRPARSAAARRKRETNTMPQWAGSCWYYLRYLDPKNDGAHRSIRRREAVDAGRPLRRRRRARGAAPAVRALLAQGAVRHGRRSAPRSRSRSCATRARCSRTRTRTRWAATTSSARSSCAATSALLKATGEELKVTVEKMAKTKMNGVNPDDVIRDYGADVLRLYEMFMGEFELPKPWDPRAIEGVNRFLKRVWRLVEEFDAAKAPADDPHLRLRHKTIKRVTARSRAHAVQHRDRGDDGVPERARRGRRQPRDARGSRDAGQAGRPVRARTWATRPGRTWARRASCSRRPGRRTTTR